MIDRAVTDSHALVWVVENKLRKLGRDARRVFERADIGQGVVYVPTLALVEIAEGVRKGSIRLAG